MKKCYYINNGVDLMAYQKSIEEEKIEDPDLIDNSKFNVTYAGTIRPVNNVGKLLDAAKIIKSRGDYSDIQFLIFGDGVQLEELKERANKERIDTVRFKGYINRQYIPYVLSRSAVNVLNYSQNQYNWSRGNSSNKLFEYMAMEKPVVSTALPECLKYTAVKIAQNVQEFVSLVEECKDACKDEKRKELLKKCAWENDWSVKAAELKAYMGEWEKNER